MPVAKLPRLGHKDVDLHTLYKEVIGRGGVMEVINKKCWKEVASVFNFPSTCTNAGYTLRINYMKLLYPYELKYFHNLSDEEVQARLQQSGLPSQQTPTTPKDGTSTPPSTPINKIIANIAASSTVTSSPFKGAPSSPLASNNNIFSPNHQTESEKANPQTPDLKEPSEKTIISPSSTVQNRPIPVTSPIIIGVREYTLLTKRSVVPGVQS